MAPGQRVTAPFPVSWLGVGGRCPEAPRLAPPGGSAAGIRRDMCRRCVVSAVASAFLERRVLVRRGLWSGRQFWSGQGQ